MSPLARMRRTPGKPVKQHHFTDWIRPTRVQSWPTPQGYAYRYIRKWRWQ